MDAVSANSSPGDAKLDPSWIAGWGAYWQTFTWFLRDALWRHRWAVATIVGIGFAVSSARLAVIGLIITYARYLSEGTTVDVLGWSFDLRTSLQLLVLVAVTTSAALLTAAGIEYVGRLWAVRLSFEHEQFCARRLLRAMTRFAVMPSGLARLTEPGPELNRASTMSCRLIGRAFRLSLVVPPAMVQWLSAALLMLYLHWVLTLILASILLVGFRILTVINRRGMEAMARLHQSTRDAQLEHQQLWDDMFAVQVDVGLVRRRIREIFQQPAQQRFTETRRVQATVTDASNFFSEGVTAIAFLLIIVFFGYRAIRGGGNWGAMIGYVIAARWGLGPMKQLISAMTSINRFMPAAHAYRQVLGLLTRPDRPRRAAWSPLRAGDASALPVLTLRPLEAPRQADSADAIALAPGRPVALVSTEPVDRFTLLGHMSAFALDDAQVAALMYRTHLINGQLRPSPVLTFRQLMHLPVDYSREALVAELASVGIESPEQLVPPALDGLASEVWSKWPTQAKFLALALATRHRGSAVVVFTQAATLQLESGTLEQIRTILAGHYVFMGLLPRQDPQFDASGIEALAVFDEGRLWGLGDRNWYDRHRATIEALQRHASALEGHQAELEQEMMMVG